MNCKRHTHPHSQECSVDGKMHIHNDDGDCWEIPDDMSLNEARVKHGFKPYLVDKDGGNLYKV